ncbi:MAG TPA: GGDEF domain-containing protein, partial [Polyangiaceae bacterium]|nr:GGDEF domain-containing protein [Polyangiaceae bacterium]
SVPEMREPQFQEEARTMEVTLRTADHPLVAPIAERALLIRMDGIHAGSVIALDQFPFGIGRHPTNQLRIDEESISRFHAKISRGAEGFVVDDLGSRNGTFVAGERVSHKLLTDETWLMLGPQVSFRFALRDLREEALMRRLYESSTRDALTSAYNRSHFDERLRAEVAYAARHGMAASLVLLDIDHFKRVNDTYGHQAGDIVLRELATRSLRSLRAEDVFARFGGEEFGVILRGIPLRGAQRLAERLRVSLANTPIQADGHGILATLSAGCASVSCCGSAPTPEEVIRIADRRLYLAKSAGRNRVIAEG